MSLRDEIQTGDAVLDTISFEFKCTENIDVFNNAFTWAFHQQTWDEIGRPREINDACFSVSPWMSVFLRVGKELEKTDTPVSTNGKT